MNETARLAEFVVDLTYQTLPADVITKAEELLLDQFAALLCASIKPWSRAVYRYARALGGRGDSSVVNYGDRMPAETAAFVNAAFGRGFEIDDTHRPSLSHPATVIIPAALALGEAQVIDGKALILALVAGYEAMGRVGRAIAPSSVERGFDPTSVADPLGAAVAAGKILGLSQAQTVAALGIAGSHSSGLMEFASSGGHTVSLHPAIAAQGGIRAALLAREGLAAPRTVLEGRNGFCRAFSDAARPEDITAEFGTRWAVNEIVYKRYHTDYFLQAPIDAALKIVREHRVEPEEIASVVVGSNRHGPRIIGALNDPRDVTESHFSAAFCIAMCLVKGSNSFGDYSDESLADPRIRDLARRVTVEADPDVDAVYPAKRAGKVTIRMASGAVFQETVFDAKGTLENPMTRAEVEDKFRALAALVLPPNRVEALIERIANLSSITDIRQITELLTA